MLFLEIAVNLLKNWIIGRTMNMLSSLSPKLTTEGDIENSPALKHQKETMAVGAAGLLLFIVMLISYLSSSMFFAFDEPIRLYFERLEANSPQWVHSTFKVIELLGSDGLTAATVILVLLWLVQRQWRPFALMAVGIAGMELTWLGWLYLINRPRPEEVISKFSNSSLPSFPSGHAMFFITFFALVLYIFVVRLENKRLRYGLITLVVLLMLLTGIIRLFFAAHFFTDVLAGYGWGLFWAVVTILLVEKFFHRRAQPDN